MKLCSPVRTSPVQLASPSLMMELQNLAEGSRCVLFQLVGGCSEMCSGRKAHDRVLTLGLAVEQLRSREQRVQGSRVPRRCSPPRSLCPWNSTLNWTPPLLPHRPFAGDTRCPSTRGWRRCSNKCTGRSHDPIGSSVLRALIYKKG